MPHTIATRQRYLRLLCVLVLAAPLLLAAPRSAHAGWRSLSGGLFPAFTSGLDFALSPDSNYAVFLADHTTDDVNELYAVPLAGGPPVRLNPPLVTGGDVQSFQIAPDSQSVFYRADQEVDNRTELYRVPITGGTATKLNAALVSGGDVSSFAYDAKNNRVVYVADAETNEVFEIWSVSGTGGGLFKLNGALVAGGDVGIYQLDPLSNRVVYSADQDIDGVYELYSVTVTGTARQKLNPPIQLQGGGDAGIYSEFAVDPIVPVVVFIARESAAPGGRLYSIPTAGGTRTQLSFNLISTQRLVNFRISPAGDRVVYNIGTRSGSANPFKGNLYSTLIGGAAAVALTETADPLFGVGTFRFTPNGQYVIYTYQQNAAAAVRLESSTTQFGQRTALYTEGSGDPPLSRFDISPDSQWVLYQAQDSGSNQGSIRAVPPTGGSPTSHGTGIYQTVTPNSQRILYTQIVSSTVSTTELFSAQIFGGSARELSGMNAAGYVGTMSVSKNSAWIVYAVQLGGRYDLRISDGLNALPPPRGVYLPLTNR